MNLMPIRLLFVGAAAYDGALGVLFLAAAPWTFDLAGIPHPNHFGYVHFAAALLAIFAILFAQIAGNPLRHRDMIVYGMLLKISYCSVVAYHAMDSGVASVWLAFAVADLVFLALFIAAWRALRRASSPAAVRG